MKAPKWIRKWVHKSEVWEEMIERIKQSRANLQIKLPSHAQNLEVPDKTYCPGCGELLKQGNAIWFVGGYAHHRCYHNLKPL